MEMRRKKGMGLRGKWVEREKGMGKGSGGGGLLVMRCVKMLVMINSRGRNR